MFFALSVSAQEQKHVVFLTDKNNNPYTLSNPGAFLTQRSLDRRTKQSIPLDLKDLPVTPDYVTQIAGTGATVVYPLKWFNAVVVNTNIPSVLAAIAALPFVDHIDQVLTDRPKNANGALGHQSVEAIPPYTITSAGPVTVYKSSDVLNYGQAYNQTHMIAVDGLHNLGYQGQGMVIAILDAGFYHADQIAAFDTLFLNGRILGTRDFNVPGSNVFGDNMHTHGTSVLSTMGANLPGQMVGDAPAASFWLIHTEVAEYEALVEEYNWAAGAELADSVGADVINSSLGYTTFDNPVFDHTYADMNGNTTPITRAADLACSRGIIVCNSAGNEGGSSWQYVGAPADGDSVFSIGAVDGAGNYAYFSSTGPTSDGRIKPDVCAQGENTTVISAYSGNVSQGSGTSFSSPIMAGAMACLWQATPSFTAQQLRDAVRNTASRAGIPDNLYGWGIPNMMNARTLLSIPFSNPDRQARFTLSPVPFSASPVLRGSLKTPESVNIEILSVAGQVMGSKVLPFRELSSFRLDDFNEYPAGIYFLRISTQTTRQVIRAIKI